VAQSVAECCSVLQCVAVFCSGCSVLQCVAVCCSELQCGAVCCSGSLTTVIVRAAFCNTPDENKNKSEPICTHK